MGKKEGYQNNVACIWSQGTFILLAKGEVVIWFVNILVVAIVVCLEPDCKFARADCANFRNFMK